jgi:hypothetical protein
MRRPRRPGAGNAPKRALATPRLFTLENRRVPPALPRSPAGPAKHLTFALLILCGRADGVATVNCSLLVNKLWRSELPCGNRRKSPRNSRPPGVCSPSVNSEAQVPALPAAGAIITGERAGPSPSLCPPLIRPGVSTYPCCCQKKVPLATSAGFRLPQHGG